MTTTRLPNDEKVLEMRRTCKGIIAAHRTRGGDLTYSKIAERFGVTESALSNALNSRNNFQSLALLSVLHWYLTKNYQL